MSAAAANISASASSVAKGETLIDTGVTLDQMGTDVIIIRHPMSGAPSLLARHVKASVINAGDGGHLHPTQTLTDMTTILRLRGSADNMKIGICGDLKYGRTVHSLIHFLANYENVQFYLIAPRELAIPEYLRQFMNEHKMKFYEVSGLEPVIPMLDVLYMTRIQRERFADIDVYESLRGIYCLTAAKLRDAKKDLLIMHPLPRVDEIAQDVDDDPRAVYFDQARFGMYARMALLLTLSKQPRIHMPKNIPGRPNLRCTNPKCITRKETYLPMETHRTREGERCIYCDQLVEYRRMRKFNMDYEY